MRGEKSWSGGEREEGEDGETGDVDVRRKIITETKRATKERRLHEHVYMCILMRSTVGGRPDGKLLQIELYVVGQSDFCGCPLTRFGDPTAW